MAIGKTIELKILGSYVLTVILRLKPLEEEIREKPPFNWSDYEDGLPI